MAGKGSAPDDMLDKVAVQVASGLSTSRAIARRLKVNIVSVRAAVDRGRLAGLIALDTLELTAEGMVRYGDTKAVDPRSPAAVMLDRIEQWCDRFDVDEKRFGELVFNAPGYVANLRKRLMLSECAAGKLTRFLDDHVNGVAEGEAWQGRDDDAADGLDAARPSRAEASIRQRAVMDQAALRDRLETMRSIGRRGARDKGTDIGRRFRAIASEGEIQALEDPATLVAHVRSRLGRHWTTIVAQARENGRQPIEMLDQIIEAGIRHTAEG